MRHGIAFIGNKHSGKTTLAKTMADCIDHTSHIMSLADPVRDITKRVLREFNERVPPILNTQSTGIGTALQLMFNEQNKEFLRFLYVGIGEGVRDIHHRFWFDTLMERVRYTPFDDTIIVDDLRHAGDATLLAKEGFKFILINKPGSDIHGDSSEQAGVAQQCIRDAYSELVLLSVDYADGLDVNRRKVHGICKTLK